jgi:hypothetical protein
MAMLAPLMVDVAPPQPDSSVTRFSVAYGGGSYAYITRGCSGEVLSTERRDFGDMGFAVSHRYAGGPGEFGLRATVFRKMPQYESGTVIWNPNAALEFRKFGFGLGYVSSPGEDYAPYYYSGREFDPLPVSGHLRFGPLRGTYFSISFLEDVPLVSGGGTVSTGGGFRVSRAVNGWFGVSWPEPFDMPGLLLKSNVHLNRSLDLNLSGRLGGSEGISESAGAIGLTLIVGSGRNAPSPESAPLPPPAPPDSAAPAEEVAPPDSLPHR